MDSSRRFLPVLWTVLSPPLTELVDSSPPESVGRYHRPPTSSRRPIGPLRRKVYAYSLLSHCEAFCAKAERKRHAVSLEKARLQPRMRLFSRGECVWQTGNYPERREAAPGKAAASCSACGTILSIGDLCRLPSQSRAGTAHCSPDECADAGLFRSSRAPYKVPGSWCRHRRAA